LNNKLLPTYTNVKVHDDAAASETLVLDFRLNLVQRQIDSHLTNISLLESEFEAKSAHFRDVVGSSIRFDAYNAIFDRVSERKYEEMQEIQLGKLYRMYGAPIFLKQNIDSVVNLSSIRLDHEMKNILSLGMNCHLRQKFDQVKKKVQVELLYEDIRTKVQRKDVIVDSEEILKSDLETFGMRPAKNYFSDVLTKEQYTKIKEFNEIDNIITRKADKSNVFVVLDREFYSRKVEEFLSDASKFSKIRKDPTDSLKREINKLIVELNNLSDSVKFRKLQGKYEPGYIYANPKIHKRIIDPPFRPIISQIGTVTYDIAKQLNNIVMKYMPRRYVVRSSYEFITMLRAKHPGNNIIASLDVESLFTNVPVEQTIDIILKNVYEHDELAPPDIPRIIMRQLLLICTTKTPFRSETGELYVQCEGVSMGSALGPCFADYYMCDLENRIFDQFPHLKPDIYARYVDDTFLLVRDSQTLEELRTKFESESVLKFTFEVERNKQLSFLDAVINRHSNRFSTSVHVKDTSLGQCLNYNSVCPDRYKIGVIKTLLYRGFHHSDDWTSFHAEIDRIKQLLSNNNFPMSIIDRTVKNFIDNKMCPPSSNNVPTSKVELYFQGQMTSDYKLQEKQLKDVITKNVKPSRPNEIVDLRIYYRNKKLCNLFIRNKPKSTQTGSERHHVVYQYTCNNDGCNSINTYIGYTTCTLNERFKMHAQHGSIKKHLIEHHGFSKVCKGELLEATKVLRYCSDRRELFTTEALMIKDLRPSLNSQEEGSERLLKIFRH